jgi:predicted  nucleic acid-binding Zn-ribbon protein
VVLRNRSRRHAVTAVVRFEDAQGELYVEVDEHDFSVEKVSRADDEIIEAADRLDTVLDRTRPTIGRLVETLRTLAPDEYEVEFGLKLNAEAGIVVAKTSAEGHFTIKMSWKREATAGDPPPER